MFCNPLLPNGRTHSEVVPSLIVVAAQPSGVTQSFVLGIPNVPLLQVYEHVPVYPEAASQVPLVPPLRVELNLQPAVVIGVVQSSGSGYYEYYWNNPVTGKEESKTAFVYKIPGIDYFIGSGIYY